MRDELTAAGEDFNEKEYEFPVSEAYFLELLREHYKVIMHKHKGFSKCNCCHYYKEQLKNLVSPYWLLSFYWLIDFTDLLATRNVLVIFLTCLIDLAS